MLIFYKEVAIAALNDAQVEDEYCAGLEKAKKIIDLLPSIDMDEIVHCKECEYCKYEDNYCWVLKINWMDDDFGCIRGKKKKKYTRRKNS